MKDLQTIRRQGYGLRPAKICFKRQVLCDLKHKMSPSDTLCFKKNIGGAVVRCLLQELRPKGGCSFYCAGPSSCRAAFTDALCAVNYYPGSDLRREHQRWAGAPGRAPFGAPSSGGRPQVCVAAPIALTDTFSFHSVLSATLCFKRGLPTERGRTDSKEVLGAAVTFYASTP